MKFVRQFILALCFISLSFTVILWLRSYYRYDSLDQLIAEVEKANGVWVEADKPYDATRIFAELPLSVRIRYFCVGSSKGAFRHGKGVTTH